MIFLNQSSSSVSENFDLNEKDRSWRHADSDDGDSWTGPKKINMRACFRARFITYYRLEPIKSVLKNSEGSKLGPAQTFGNKYCNRLNSCVFLSAKQKKEEFSIDYRNWRWKSIYGHDAVNKKQWLSPGQIPLQTPKP